MLTYLIIFIPLLLSSFTIVSELPKQVKEVIKENVQILVEEYGEERTEEDLGGFIALTDEEGIKELKENLLKNKIQ